MICAFILPTHFLLNTYSIDVTNYIFLSLIIILYTASIIKEKRISKYEVILLFLIIILCVIRQELYPLYLIEYMSAYKYINSSDFKNTNKKAAIIISLVGVAIYSCIYLGYANRYIYTGIREINQSSFALFMLFLIIRKKYHKLGTFLLLIGLLTLSRNYAVCLILLLILELISKSNLYQRIYKLLNIRVLMIVATVILLLSSIVFEISYNKGLLNEYKEGINRYSGIMDYSNYHRFTVNKKVIEIYAQKPHLLISGIEDETFYQESLRISRNKGKPFRKIKPHNYFFSYIRIYGIWSIIIFIYLIKLFDKITTKENAHILLIIMVYANILGIGLANYWLFLSIITMLTYKEGN